LPVNIIGQGFSTLHNVKVRFGAQEGRNTEIKNDQHIKSEVPDLNEGAVALTIVADEIPAGQFVGGFSVGTPPSPLCITDLYPDYVSAAGGTPFNVFGVGFLSAGRTAAVTVTFGSTTVPGNATDDTLITCTAPSAAQAGVDPSDSTANSVRIVVTLSDGTALGTDQQTTFA
jgi:hypothetical protein